jgi:hypothetical protein
MFLHVSRAKVIGAHAVRVEFTDGSLRDVDLSPELHGEVFEPLRDPEFFAAVQVNPDTGTLEWPNGADFAPEFLFEAGTPVERVA